MLEWDWSRRPGEINEQLAKLSVLGPDMVEGDLERFDKASRHFVFRVGDGARVDEPSARRDSDERGRLKSAGFTQWRQNKFNFDDGGSNEGHAKLEQVQQRQRCSLTAVR